MGKVSSRYGTSSVPADRPSPVQRAASTGEASWGWLVVLAGFAVLLFWSGFLKTMGVLLDSVTEDLTERTGITGEISAMAAGVRCIVGPFAGPLGDRFGYRPVVMVTGFLAATGIMLASFLANSVEFAICLALISGSCFSAPVILTKAMIGKYYHTRFALAISVASGGDSISMIVVPSVVQLFLETYGWRGALLLYGALCLHLVAVGALLRDPPGQDGGAHGYQSIRKDDEELELEDTQREETNSGKGKAEPHGGTFNVSILKSPAFLVLCFVMVGKYVVGISWYLYFIPHAEAKGFKPKQALALVMAVGIGQILTKIVAGKLIDSGLIGVRAFLALCISGCSVTMAVDPLIHTFWPMLVVTVIFGSFFGLVYPLVDVFAKEIAGADGLASAFGYLDLIGGIARITFGFLPGFIYEKTGSYDIAFVILGGIYLVVLIPVLAEWALSKRSNTSH